ncbi:PhzF family phenazine biosynthesis protein [Sphingomonas sp. PB2P12]|uniref:PhzF family phenazine biosynthesis protein n=1 Tax=Sphingomonas sandaracina TaxID=3096157 RepID=UPI002FC65D15
MRIPFAQIDAFSDTPFGGNQAAVMPLSAWLDDDVLLNIAQENNVSETAFIVASDEDGVDFDLRWFTPGAEVALCGHATLASGHFVLSSDTARNRVRFRTRQAGMLEVVRVDTGYTLELPAWGPSPKAIPEIVAALNITSPIETLWHEKGYALVIVENEAAVRNLKPDFAALAKFPIVAIVAARGEATDIVSRVFTPYYAIDEDPVTGAAHAVMVPYWASTLGNSFTAFQASARGGKLTCRLEGNRVVLGGSCVTTIEGTFLLP